MGRMLSDVTVEVEEKGDEVDWFKFCLKLVILIFLPCFSYIHLKKNHDEMKEKEFKSKFHTLYTNLDLNKDIAYIYTMLFCVKRIIFALAGTFF